MIYCYENDTATKILHLDTTVLTDARHTLYRNRPIKHYNNTNYLRESILDRNKNITQALIKLLKKKKDNTYKQDITYKWMKRTYWKRLKLWNTILDRKYHTQ